jgi:hypothetical protein
MESVKRSIDAYNRRDLDGDDELFTPDFELLPGMAGTIEDGNFSGRKGADARFGDIDDTREQNRMATEEIRGLGDRVLWLRRFQGRRRGSRGPSKRRSGRCASFVTASSRAPAPISITARRCGRVSSQSSRSRRT